MKLLASLLPLLALPAEAPSQDPAPENAAIAPARAAADVSAEAQEAWRRITGAMSIEGERAPVSQFVLRAEVRARDGVRSNDLEDVTYRFLAPNFIRFGVGPNRETGRGPGKGQAAYWLRDGERVTQLSGREFKQDRDLVKRMTTVALNVIALSDPAKLDVRALELRETPPAMLPERLAWTARRLTWVEFTSPDFDLYRDEPQVPFDPLNTELPPERIFRVVLGTDRKSHEPVLVMLREEVPAGAGATPTPPPTTTGEPLLFQLADIRDVSGFRIPHKIQVRGLEPGAREPLFQERPAQEIAVLAADLAPGFTPADFAPGMPEAESPR